MPDAQPNRRLAAILAADVVGYSRMMADDEAGTLAALKRHREAVFDPAIANHKGRVVKLMGDGTLAEFASVVDAVNCAFAIQRSTAEPRIVLRIGVNLGDVIIEGDDIYGDGVNIAARLEPLAEPGGICIASIVNESVGNRADGEFADAGEVQVKNIARAIRVWKWSPGGTASAAPAAPAAPPKADAPSIAVLPFENMSGDREQDYFSDGISEDIITDLSQVAGLTVIARNSCFAYKGRHVDIRVVARELGVRFVLEGSIRRAGSRVRITAQLIDAETGGHLWAKRYDRDLTDVFEVQDDVTRQIVFALKVTLTPRESARIAAGAGTTDMEAYDLFLRASAVLRSPSPSRASIEQSCLLFKDALRRDPNYASAHAGLGIAETVIFMNGWSERPADMLAAARQHADMALAAAPEIPFAHFVGAMVAMAEKDVPRWRQEITATLARDPNHAMALGDLGMISVYAGDPLAGLPHIERSMRLDPAFSHQIMHYMGMAFMVAGKYETAAFWFRERIRASPGTDASRAYLASSLGHLGQVDEARRVWQELIGVNPKYSFETHMARLPFSNPSDVGRIREGLRKAGVLAGETA